MTFSIQYLLGPIEVNPHEDTKMPDSLNVYERSGVSAWQVCLLIDSEQLIQATRE